MVASRGILKWGQELTLSPEPVGVDDIYLHVGFQGDQGVHKGESKGFRDT